MSNPTRSELETQLQNIVFPFEQMRQFASVEANNFVGLQDVLERSLEGDFNDLITSRIRTVRAAINSALGSGRGVMEAHLQDWAKFLGRPGADIGQIMNFMYDDFIDNSITVHSREFTFGSPAADAGNVGDGIIHRLTKDNQNFDIENSHAESKRIECVNDQNSGRTKNEERFIIEGSQAERDLLQLIGSGQRAELLSAVSLNRILLNASFDDVTLSSGSTTGITNWTSSVDTDSTNYGSLSSDDAAANSYLPPVDSQTAKKSLVIKTTAVLTQQINDRRRSLDVNTPYFFIVYYNRDLDGTASGTLTVDFGDVQRSAAVSGSGWQRFLVPATVGQNNWFPRLNKDDFTAQITWTPNSGSGGLAIDDILLVPFTFFDGHWYVAEPGRTPWLARTDARTNGDLYTFTDTEANPGGIQYWMWRFVRRYLPHAVGSLASIADPV